MNTNSRMWWLGKPKRRASTKLGDICKARNLGDTMPMSPDSPNSSPSETAFEGEEAAGQERQAPPNRTVKSEMPASAPGRPELEAGFEADPGPSGEVSPNFGAMSLCTCGSRRTKRAGCRVHRVCSAFCEVGDGYCACGFPRDEHSVCEEYRVNLEAATFAQTCKCGFAKEEHATPAAPARGRSSRRENEDDLRARFTHKEKASCTMYRVNLHSASFGECLCGLPKASHSDEALKQSARQKGGAGRTTRRDEDELRSRFVQREYVECTNYEVDMAPGVQYGMCRCGKPRAEHSNRALQGGKPELKAKRTNEDVLAQMKARAAVAEAAPTTHAPPTRGLRPQPRALRDPMRGICPRPSAHSPQQPPLKKSSLMRARRVMA